jgi:hypothetical protein
VLVAWRIITDSSKRLPAVVTRDGVLSRSGKLRTAVPGSTVRRNTRPGAACRW